MTRYKAVPHFPPPKINHNRPPLPSNRANFIAGDPAGLYRLAESIYGFVSTQSGTVDTLRDSVIDVVKNDDEAGGFTPGPDGGWIGDTAYLFRNTFISDAAMMNGLNSVMCTIAATVDDLASKLATRERDLEFHLEDGISRTCRMTFTVNYLVTKGSGTSPEFELTGQGEAAVNAAPVDFGPSDVVQLCNSVGASYFDEAHKLRSTAASQLAAVGKILQEAFSYYNAHSAGPGSPSTSDPSVLLSSDQATSDAVAANRLQGEYSKLAADLKNGSLDDNAVKSTLSGLGVAAGNVGTILDGIKNVKDAKGTISTGSKFASLVGQALPMLMMIGMSG